ncbi:hypothetical protein GCM10010411_74150 [Actinomadura fulvescens]|uniref:Uncharacterized protein n=1 Tax=Actinomadura fulvescens TaxID=46160 RepID=A0ABN3QH23_9ACTN
MDTTYTAAIATASDVVAGEYCDVLVAENDVVGYRDGEGGQEVPVLGMSDRVVMEAVETTVRTTDDDKLGLIEQEAEQILAAHGWQVVGPWELSDNAAYAAVQRA